MAVVPIEWTANRSAGTIEAKTPFLSTGSPSLGNPGALYKDGALLQVGNPRTYGTPNGQVSKTDSKGRPVGISWWSNVHVKEARWLPLTVIQVVRPHAHNTERDPRISWLIWLGDEQEEVAEVALGYALRFGQEHGYRFDKQGLLWDEPRLRTDIHNLSDGAI